MGLEVKVHVQMKHEENVLRADQVHQNQVQIQLSSSYLVTQVTQVTQVSLLLPGHPGKNLLPG